MPHVVKDRVQETSTTTGTGTLTLGGAVTGFQTFSSAIGNTNTTYYAIQNGSEWEVGIGTVGAGTLSRDTILESSNAGAAVNLSAGTKQVFCTYPAEKSVDLDTAQTLSNKTISGSSNTLSNIGNSSLTNSSITVNGTGISLGGSATVTAVNPNALTIGTGLSGTSYNGSAAVTIAIDSTVATLTGTQTLTNKTLTSPRVGTAVLDTNGNEVFAITATASAVNDFTLVNAATGNTPQIQASGGDTNISLNLVPKGTGTVQAGGVPVVTTTGTQTLTNKTLTSPTMTGSVLNDGYTEEVFAITDGASVVLSPTNGSIQTWTLGASRTPTQGTWAAGQSITLMINDTASLFQVTWTSIPVTWVGGSAPTLAPGGGFTVITLWKVGTTVYGALVGQVA